MIVGRVLANGVGVAGAVVTVRRGEAVADGITDARGGFDVAVDEGTYELRVGAAGYLPDYRARVATGTPVELHLRRGGVRVSGTVRDLDGRPIAGARVDADCAVAFTDGVGRYSMTLPVGSARLAVTHDAHAASSRPFGLVDDRDDVDFALERAAQIRGVVRTRDGAPVAGASIHADLDGRPMSLRWNTATDEHGAFATVGLRGGSLAIVARAPGYASPQRHAVVAQAGEVVTVELVLVRACTLRGRVVDATGAPQADADVRVYGRTMADTRYVIADAHGEFVVHALFPGRFNVNARVGESDADLELELDRDTDGLVLDVGELLELSGRVEPPAACELRHADTLVAHAGNDGQFLLRGLLPGAHDLTVATDDGQRARVEALGPAHDVVVPLAPGRTVEGTASYEDGAPIPDATVRVIASEERRVALTDAAGRFRILGMPHRRARAELEGGTSTEVELGERARLVRSRATGTLRGVVRDERGEPVEGARVTVDTRHARTGADGAFAFAQLPQRVYTIRALGPRGDSHGELRANVGATHDVVLIPLAAIEGRVTLAGAPVPVFTIGDARFEAPDGSFALPRQWPGRHRLYVESPVGDAVVEVEVGREAVRVDIEIPTAQVVRGRAVSALDETPLAGIAIAATEFSARGRTGDDGRFELHRVPPGAQLRFDREDRLLGLARVAAEDLGDVALAPPARERGELGAYGNLADGRINRVGEPAASAGVRVGDRVVALDGIALPAHLSIYVLMASLERGRTYALTLARGEVIAVTAE